jgi:hypothetical protein
MATWALMMSVGVLERRQEIISAVVATLSSTMHPAFLASVLKRCFGLCWSVHGFSVEPLCAIPRWMRPGVLLVNYLIIYQS